MVAHLNRISRIFRLFLMTQKSVLNESETILREIYFGHVVFFLGRGVKKI